MDAGFAVRKGYIYTKPEVRTTYDIMARITTRHCNWYSVQEVPTDNVSCFLHSAYTHSTTKKEKHWQMFRNKGVRPIHGVVCKRSGLRTTVLWYYGCIWYIWWCVYFPPHVRYVNTCMNTNVHACIYLYMWIHMVYPSCNSDTVLYWASHKTNDMYSWQWYDNTSIVLDSWSCADTRIAKR